MADTFRSALKMAGGSNCSDWLQCRFRQGQPSGDSLQVLICVSWRFYAVIWHRFSLIGHKLTVCVLDGCRSKLVNVVSGVPHGSVLGPQLFVLYTVDRFTMVKNKLYGYANDSLGSCCAIRWWEPVAEALAYLHVQVSPISWWVAGSILALLG